MKNKVSLFLVVVLSLTLVACSSKTKDTDFFGEDEKAKRPKVTTTTKLSRNWRINLGKSFSRNDAQLKPAISGSNVYSASINGSVYKVSLENGKRIWNVKFKKTNITGGVSAGEGLVLAGTNQGRLLALKQEDGSVAWEAKLATAILSSPVIDDDIVIARTIDEKVYGISAFDGEILWTISRKSPSLTLRGESQPLLIQGITFVGFSDGTLAALDAKTGRALWDFPISFPRGTNELENLSDVDTTPLLVGKSIYVSSTQDVTHSLDIQEQKLAWSEEVSSTHALAFDAAYLYVSDREGVIHQLDRSSGEKVWSQEGLRLFSTSAPVSLGSYVVVGDGDGNLYTLNKSDGSFAGRHSLGAKSIVGDPLVEDDSMIFADSSGSLQSLRINER